MAASGPGSATQATQAISSGVFLLDDLRRIKERIYQVLERRATLSLAQTGWVFYQQHFFHAELAEAMLRISRVLAAKGEQDVFLSRCMQYGCGEDQPVHIAESWVEDQGRPIHVLKDGWSLAAQLSSLAVVEGGRFGTLLLHAFFTRCPLERIPQETALFGVALELATTDEQAQMLTALYGDYRLEPAFDAVSQLVLKHCGMPRKGNDHPVWGSVSQQVRQHFRQWALINMVSQHVEGQSRKLAFYQPLLMRLFDCVQLNPDVLMLEFPQFYLLDHKDFSHQVVYYEKPTLQLALESKSDPETLSIPQGQWSTARDLILNQNRSNRVLLKLEEVNLLYARDFIESVQNPGKRSSVI